MSDTVIPSSEILELTTGHRVAAVTWGDIHFEQLNSTVALRSWGFDMKSRAVIANDNILDRLRPEYQFLHDTKDPEGAADAHNAYYWHDLNADWHRAIRDNVVDFNIVRRGMRRAGLADDIQFVSSGGSYVVGDVECGLHGDLGVGGSRGSPNQYRRFGPKTSSGHTHTPKIVEGVYVAGSARISIKAITAARRLGRMLTSSSTTTARERC